MQTILKKIPIKEILIFLFFFFVSFLLSSVIVPIWCDQIWSYGFSYQISQGLLPYRDFHMLQMPFYFMIASIFIRIFGNYMISTCLFDSFLMACVSFLFYRMVGWKSIFSLLLLFVFVPSPYNLLCMFFLTIILYMIHKDCYDDLLAALLVGFIFITKQNIGVLLFFPMIFYSKKKWKSLLLFLLPFSLLSIYFLCSHAFFSFIDYCFFGLFEFHGNQDIRLFFLLIELAISSYLIYRLWKSRFQDKEALYILAFQFVVYPLCEIRHFMLSYFFFLSCFLKVGKKLFPKVLITLASVLYVGGAFFTVFYPFDIHLKHDFLYLRSPSEIVTVLDEVYSYFDGDIQNVFFESDYSYLLKLYYGVPLSKFDFYLDGNLGHFLLEKNHQELKDYCEKNTCHFLLLRDVDIDSSYQSSYFREYVTKHYQKIGNIYKFEIYG